MVERGLAWGLGLLCWHLALTHTSSEICFSHVYNGADYIYMDDLSGFLN